MTNAYVQQRDGAYFVANTRISLDSVVHAFLNGESAEGIVESFPLLQLEQVFGALAFYLANREVVDEYLRQGHADFEEQRARARLERPALYAKLDAARREIAASRK